MTRVFKRILVPLDGSSFGEAALGPAAALARRSGGELRLLNVYEPGWNLKHQMLAPEYRSSREDYLAGAGLGLFQVKLSTIVRQGQAEKQILEEARSWGADIIVMSTHGRGGVSRLWLGSVADHTVRRADIPLLLIRARPTGESNGEAFYPPKRLIVPLDGSDLAEGALIPAAALSESLKAPIVLLRVVQPLAFAAPIGTTTEWEPIDPTEAVGLADDYLGHLVTRLRSQGHPVTSEVAFDPNPAQAIIDCAAGDLVVMSTHARPPVERAVLGSVTDKVVRASRGPVVVIPPSSPFVRTAEHRDAREGPPVHEVALEGTVLRSKLA